MATDGTYTAVLDRIEVTQADDELAVLLLERDGDIEDELVVAREQLPSEGQHQDAVFKVTVTDDELQAIEYQPTETEERSEAAQSRFDPLSRRPPDTDDTEDS